MTESAATPANMYEMTPNEVRAWLDEGNLFVLPFGQSEYRVRKIEDGAYVCYHMLYSTFGELVQRAAGLGPAWTLNEQGVPGPAMYEMTYKDQQAALDTGKVFSAPLSMNEAFTMRKVVDGSYVMYSVQRDTFEALQQSMANKGAAYLWEAKTAQEVDGTT